MLRTPHVVREDEVQKWLGSVIPGTPVFGLTTDRATLLKLPAHWEGPDGFVTNSGIRSGECWGNLWRRGRSN